MKPDLERALGMAHGVQAEYLLMAASAEEKQVKQVFETMAEDLDRHIKVLRSRQDYLQKWGEQLQQPQGGGQGQSSGSQASTGGTGGGGASGGGGSN